jgi:hypothetical protein
MDVYREGIKGGGSVIFRQKVRGLPLISAGVQENINIYGKFKHFWVFIDYRP